MDKTFIKGFEVMANQWFRMYHEFATDPKIQMLLESDQRRYIMLLCMRCSNGDVTLHDNEVAFQLRVTNEDWSTTKATLIEKKLITKENKPTAWDKRQYISDSSAERVKKHRDKKKYECNVTVTPPDTDTDTDTEKNNVISFEKFYLKYPLKKSKDPAKKKWKILSVAEKQLAFDGIDHYISTVKDKNYLVHPSTYLNQKRWQDESQTPHEPSQTSGEWT